MMKYWKKYEYHEIDLRGKRKYYDNNVYTFDIETTSYIILDGKQYDTLIYDRLDEKEKRKCLTQATMYIWMFGINDTIYYGRTWEELKIFLSRVNENVPDTKYLWIHNFAYEFQFLKSQTHFDDVLARKKHKVMTAFMMDYNFIVKCSYMSSESSLAGLTKNFALDIEKKTGDLDYLKCRHFKTPLTEKELYYCEYDCLVLYKYVLKELEVYETVKNIPTTNTGKVRRALKDLTMTNYRYKNYVRKSVNTEPHIYNLLIEVFQGGYTHANRLYSGDIIKNVDSWDFTSSYPWCMVSEKYPSTAFKKCNLKDYKKMSERFAYILVVKFTNIRTKYYNTFISMSKCRNIKGGVYDNGRIIKADEIIVALTDVDFKFIIESHYIDNIEIIESYYSLYKYLPIELIKFILELYAKKTELKGVEGHELEYNRLKGMLNSTYGMSVTNNIRDEVVYHDESGEWDEVPITNEEIIEKLIDEKKAGFLSFSWGCWVTARGRYNLLSNLVKLDEFVIYSDTDSLKLKDGYDKNVILDYNNGVLEKINKTCEILGLDKKLYSPCDIKGHSHPLGVFDHEGEKYNQFTYEKFITQGAKKYAYSENKLDKETNKYIDKISITVSGVPKKAKCALKRLEDFKDNFVFKYEDTGKNTLFYNDSQIPFRLTDYLGNTEEVRDFTGICMVPTSYTLGRSEEYAHLISDDSSRRAIYKE